MVGQRHVLLHLEDLLRVEVARHAFGAVHHAALQCLVQLAEGHHLRHGAQRAHLGVEHLAGLDAHLQAAEVGHAAQRPVGAHDLEAVVPVGQALDALGLQLPEQLGAERALGDGAEGVGVLEQVGQVEDLELLDAQRPELGKRRRQHLHRTQLQRLQLFLVLVELAVGVQLHLHLAAGALLGQLLEALRALALGRVGRHHMAELDDDGRLRGGREGQRQRSGEHEATRGHVCLLDGRPGILRSARRALVVEFHMPADHRQFLYCGDELARLPAPQPVAGATGPVAGVRAGRAGLGAGQRARRARAAAPDDDLRRPQRRGPAAQPHRRRTAAAAPAGRRPDRPRAQPGPAGGAPGSQRRAAAAVAVGHVAGRPQPRAGRGARAGRGQPLRGRPLAAPDRPRRAGRRARGALRAGPAA